MGINLSEEMIRKVTEISFARINELKQKIADNEKPATQRKKIYMYDLNKALDDAEEVHQLFISMLNEIEGQ